MLDWLWQADAGLWLGALGFVTGIASVLYARSQAHGAHAQVENSRQQAEEALRAAGLVADSARQQALEALRAASLVAEGARQQAVEALRAAGLVAENARLQAEQALRAAELLASSAVAARLREVRARNFRASPDLPPGIRAIIRDVGGPDAYAVLLDALDVAQEIHALRSRGMVSDGHWRMWMDDQMALVAQSPSFQEVFRRAAESGVLTPRLVAAFAPVFDGGRFVDPAQEPADAAGAEPIPVPRPMPVPVPAPAPARWG